MALVWMAGCMDQPVKNTTPEPGPAILVDYSRTGGIGGFDDHLVIFENGAAVYSGQRGRGAFIVNPNTLGAIRDSFYSIGFTRMNASYPAPSPGADYFTYTITYHNYTVRAEDTGVPFSSPAGDRWSQRHNFRERKQFNTLVMFALLQGGSGMQGAGGICIGPQEGLIQGSISFLPVHLVFQPECIA